MESEAAMPMRTDVPDGFDGNVDDGVDLYEVDDLDVLEVSEEISAEFHDAYVRLSDLP